MISISPIQKSDNQTIAKVIRDVLIEHNVPKVGTAYADASLDCMFETYNQPKRCYFILKKEGKIIGGAGINILENADKSICELQKMYFLSEARGSGNGSLMMEKCLETAKSFGYKQCYLETMPYMKDAQKLYLKFGFQYIDKPLGNTGHTSCPVWMLKDLY